MDQAVHFLLYRRLLVCWHIKHHETAAACAEEKIQRQMQGMQLVKTIVVKNKLVNLILKPAK